MTPQEYVKRAIALESNDYEAIQQRLIAFDFGIDKLRLLHALVGINTENGELQDQFKKYVFYGKELDKVNLIEEIGDLMWYVALACDELNVSLEEVMTKNLAKLELRYKDKKFSETQALNRDLVGERQALESYKNVKG